MRIYRSQVRPSKPIELGETYSFSRGDCEKEYPLVEIPDCRFEASFYDEDGHLRCSYRVSGNWILVDGRTAKEFSSSFEEEGDIDILSSFEEEGEGYVFPGTFLESEELAHKIVKTLVPVSPHAEGSELPKGGEGYDVLTEEEANSEESESPFDAIPDDYA